MQQEIIKFVAGTTYAIRSIGDHNCIFSEKIVKRTEKTVTTESGKMLRISMRENVETVRPEGTYSMAPTLYANRPARAGEG
ncbi:MAG: hypothetical protein ACYCZR_11865 [Burkholderiales bacterium]